MAVDRHPDISIDVFTTRPDTVFGVTYVVLAPGARASVPLAINRKEFARTPALGEMVVSLDNVTKENEQALLLRLVD